MAFGIVPAVKNGIFKTHTALSREVVFLQKADHFFQGPCLLDGHHLQALLGKRVVQAHRQMAFAFIQVFAEHRQHADGAQGHPFGAPGQSPAGRKDVDDAPDLGPVVQRLPHAHENGIGQLARLFDGEKL